MARALVACLVALDASAATKNWNGGVLWHNVGSWSPTGVPTTNDIAVLARPNILLLDAHSAFIESLEMSSGATLATNGSLLTIRTNAGTGTIQLAGSTTQLVVNPRKSGSTSNAVDTHQLNLSGSTLAMNGGVVNVRDRLRNVSGDIIGRGTVDIEGTGSRSLDNVNGTISAEGGLLKIQNSTSGRLDLDGSSPNETLAVINAVEGNSTLVVDGPLNDAFDGTFNIGSSNLAQFFQGLSIGAQGVLNFDAAGGAGTLSADQFSNLGTVNVHSGTAAIGATNGTARLSSNAGSSVNVANAGRLQLQTDAEISNAGTMNMAGGFVFGSPLTNHGTIVGQGQIGTQNLINHGTIEANGGTLTINTVVGVPDLGGAAGTGQLKAHNGTLDLDFNLIGVAVYDGGVVLHNQGELRSSNPFRVDGGGFVVMNPGSRFVVEDGGYIQSEGSSLTVTSGGAARIESEFFTSLNGNNVINGQLELDGTFYVGNTASLAGNGALLVEDDARLAAQTGTFFGVNVLNDGRLTPGILSSGSAAAINFDQLILGNTSVLEIEIGGTTPGADHDRITADALFLNGELTLNVVGGFLPAADDTFDITSADQITGIFDNVLNGQRLDTIDGEASFMVHYGPGSAFDPNRIILSDFMFNSFGFSGDYNGNGQIEQGDLDLVLQNWGVDTDAAGAPAGWTGSPPEGLIDQLELDGVLQNWGILDAPEFHGLNVPEPAYATWLLLPWVMRYCYSTRR